MTLLVSHHIRCIYTSVRHILLNKPSMLVIGDLPDKANLQPKLGTADDDISRRTADIFGEGQGFFHRAVILNGIQVKTSPTNGNNVVFFRYHFLLHSYRSLSCYSNEGLGYLAVTTFFLV
ncbi:hypothetical protein D3C73_1067330 [compost metagenome]